MSPWLRAALTLAAGLGVLAAADQAQAWCRLTTGQAFVSRCPEPCGMEGIPLAWQQEAVYTFNEGFIPGLSEADVRRIFADSFGEWTRTDCEMGPIDLFAQQAAEPTDVSAAIKDDGLSVVVYRTAQEWDALHEGSRMAFALTIVAFDTNTGELVGADMELNGGIGTFSECPDEGCAPGDAVDLANVVTHEAGHFFGLAHSDVPGSTMSCDARGYQVDKRTLEQDDIEGICAAYGSVPPPGDSDGCQAGGSGPGVPALAGWLLGGLLLVQRRRTA